ncbi:MAG: stage II sporulation protein R [Ruminiclostridium sp.]|nr:stage II sporulation protein R [Ruminiclostridium sp.]
MTPKEKLLDISMLLGTAAAVLISAFAGFAKECDEMKERTFRLHILANSDSAYDQRIKYELRDHIVDELGTVFSSCETKDETKALAQRNLPYIEQRANEFLQSRGCEYTAVCTVCEDEFPTRVYEDYTLPSGRYDALRIVIGDGNGKNWWCVLYPSVCVSAASAVTGTLPARTLYENRKAADRMTADSLIDRHDGIEYRFALYDIIRSLFFSP